MLNKNHESISGLNFDSGLSVSFTLNNLSNCLGDNRGRFSAVIERESFLSLSPLSVGVANSKPTLSNETNNAEKIIDPQSAHFK